MTVSRVLNDPEHVSPTTHARVMAAIQALGYRRNVAARALVTGRSETLGVVTFDTTLYGPASTLYAIEHAAATEKYAVTIATAGALDRASIRQALTNLTAQGVDGVILIVPFLLPADAIGDLAAELPVVAVEGDPGIGIPVVMCDQHGGARTATQHLLDVGHSTVWHVAGPASWTEAEARRSGWQSSLEAAGAEVPPPIYGDWTPRSGYEAGLILSRIPEVTAVFAANDQMALGVMRALSENDRDVPGDVSVIGFDDVPEANYFNPPLTTVRQDFTKVGHNALRLVIEQITADRKSVV